MYLYTYFIHKTSQLTGQYNSYQPNQLIKYLPIYTWIRLISDKLTLTIELRQFNFVL